MLPHDPCKPSGHYVVRSELEAYMDKEIRHLRDLVDRVTMEKTRALELQGVEYARRLEELERRHDRAEKSYSEWKEEVQASITMAEGATAANAKFFAIVVAVTGLIFSAITIWMKKG